MACKSAINKQKIARIQLSSYFSPHTTAEAGIDEAGRGCLAGPVVAAAVIWPRTLHHPLIKDSKQLNAAQRAEAKAIVMELATAWSIGTATPEEIDKHNILQATFLAMHRAVEALTVLPDMLLIDGNRFKPYPFLPHECIIKGDGKMLSIAAASILAKTHRDELMQALAEAHPQYGWQNNKGYPTAAHYKSISLHGITIHHRRSFLRDCGQRKNAFA
jgi:ribonuclease HII